VGFAPVSGGGCLEVAMHRGYVKIWRKMIESQVFSIGLEYIGLLAHLLLVANYRPGWFMGFKVEQGQIACGIPKMAERLSVSRSKLYRMLKKLEELGIIEQQMNSKFTLITICNYSTYQGQYCDEKQESEQQVNSERTASEQQVNSEWTQLKKGKKEKKEKKSTGGSVMFVPPTVEEVMKYCEEKGYSIDPERFIAYYETRGWMLKDGKMKSWAGALKTWALNDKARWREDYIKKHGRTPESYDRQADEFLAFCDENEAKGALNVLPA